MEDEVRVLNDESEVTEASINNDNDVRSEESNSANGSAAKALLWLALGAAGGTVAAVKWFRGRKKDSKTRKALRVVEIDENGNIINNYSKESNIEETEE